MRFPSCRFVGFLLLPFLRARIHERHVCREERERGREREGEREKKKSTKRLLAGGSDISLPPSDICELFLAKKSIHFK